MRRSGVRFPSAPPVSRRLHISGRAVEPLHRARLRRADIDAEAVFAALADIAPQHRLRGEIRQLLPGDFGYRDESRRARAPLRDGGDLTAIEDGEYAGLLVVEHGEHEAEL